MQAHASVTSTRVLRDQHSTYCRVFLRLVAEGLDNLYPHCLRYFPCRYFFVCSEEKKWGNTVWNYRPIMNSLYFDIKIYTSQLLLQQKVIESHMQFWFLFFSSWGGGAARMTGSTSNKGASNPLRDRHLTLEPRHLDNHPHGQIVCLAHASPLTIAI